MLRGRGYASAVTAAASADALARGAEQVLLYTDLANPTSNSIYQRLGYRPIADEIIVDLTIALDRAIDHALEEVAENYTPATDGMFDLDDDLRID